MEFKPKNREWVKNAAIVLLAVLLVLTFFSNTIMNRTLPEVATQYVTNGSVTAKVRGSGTVVANGSHQVKADQDREIRSVMVRVGQEVNAGDVLFVLGEGDADELEAAQEQLRQLQISYQRAAINSPVFSYSSDERKLKNLEDAYNDAKTKVELALKNIPQKDQDKINAAESALKDAQEQLDELQSEFDQRRQAALEKVNYLQGVVDRLRAEEEAEPSPTPTTPEGTQQPENSSQPGEQESPPPNGEASPAPSQNTYESQPDGGQSEAGPAPSEPSPSPNDGETEESPAPTAESLAWNGVRPRVSLLAAGGTTPSPSVTDEPKTPLEKALAELEAAKLELAQMDETTDPAIAFATELRDKAQAEYDALTNSPSSPQMVAYNEAVAAMRAAEIAYLDAKDALEAQKVSDNKQLQSTSLDLADLSQQIEKQKKKIEELSGGEGNQVTANVSGTVESVECTAGDYKMKDDILCTIEVPDMGYTLSFSVTNDQARRLAPGDSATISNYYWGSQIVATLSTIRVDPKNPQTNKLLTFDLEGDVTAGSEITLAVGQRSANYDTIVPNSAIRSDSNGSFVLKIEQKSSPLGNRYIARRVDVEVLAADDVNSAVSGDLSGWEYVITTSNAPVENGNMVRMADNG